MLDAWTSVEINILLDLGLLLACGGLVDWHLDVLVEIADDDRSEGRELGVEHLVIN